MRGTQPEDMTMPQNPILFDDGFTIVFDNNSNHAGLLPHTIIYLLNGNDDVTATSNSWVYVYGGMGNDVLTDGAALRPGAASMAMMAMTRSSEASSRTSSTAAMATTPSGVAVARTSCTGARAMTSSAVAPARTICGVAAARTRSILT